MSLPNNIYATPSTTVVQVNPLQSPYTPVLLNSVVYPGQTITVLDATSSIGALTNPIVVSTQALTFDDGTISTLINQPQGFITAQTNTANTWSFLNSFPFRNQNVSAGLLNLTTSTLYTALLSTSLEYISSLNVQNLTVTGNFVQSKGLVLNTNVSSLGTVEFMSSLNVWGNVYLSSGLIAYGGAEFYSSLTVSGNLRTNSSIQTKSSFYVSSSLYALGPLSTTGINFRDGLVGTSLDIQQSTLNPLLIAGSTEIGGNLSTFSSIYLGNPFQTNSLLANNLTLLSSASLFAEGNVDTYGLVRQNLSTSDSLGIGGGLVVGLNFTSFSSITANSGYIQDRLTVAGSARVSTLITTNMEINGNFANNSTIAQITQNSSAANFGAGYVQANSTVFTSLNAFSSLQTRNATIDGLTNIYGSVSTFSIATSSITNTNILKNLSVLGQVFVSTLSIFGDTQVYGNTFIQQNVSVGKDVYILGSIACSTFQISSATFPSTILANDLTAESVLVGTFGITNQAFFSSIRTSSFTYGYIPNSAYPFDLSGNFNFSSRDFISAPVLSTSLFYEESGISTQLFVRGGVGVGVPPANSTLVSQPIGYFLNNTMYIFSTLSTNVVNVANSIESYFIGNGAGLSNFAYPPNLSCLVLYISSSTDMNTSGFVNTSTFLTSTLNSLTIYDRSTMMVGSFSIYGNANSVVYGIPKNILQTDVANRNLVLNGMDFIGNTTTPQVLVNYNGSINPSCNQPLRVLSTLATTTIGNDQYILTAQTYSARNLITNLAYGAESNINFFSSLSFTGVGSVYISSGSISTTTGKFFIGESDTYDPRFNIVQPFRSTLQFNSTLFVNRLISSVGFNCQPNFSLDAPKLAIQGTTTAPNGSTILSNTINLTPNNSTFYYAFVTQAGSYSNVLYSSNVSDWSNASFLFTTTNTNTYNGYISVGLSQTSNSDSRYLNEYNPVEYFFGQSVFAGLGTTQYSLVSEPSYLGGKGMNTYTVNFNQTFRAAATDGATIVLGGTYSPTVSNSDMLAKNRYLSFFNFGGITGSASIFPANGIRSNGCYGLGFSKFGLTSVWLAVGYGSGNSNMYASLDTETWTETGNGIFTEARAVIALRETSSFNEFYAVAGASSASGSNVNRGAIAISPYPFSWVTQTNIFTGSALCLATDGNILVIGGEDINGLTLQYIPISNLYSSYFTTPFSPTFTVCGGSLFSTRTNSVLWSGSNWIAAGDSGIRQSYDGITWFNPASLTMEVFSVGFGSNAATTISVGNSNQSTPLFFLDTPYPSQLQLISTPTVSFYPSSILNLNNACIFDAAQNIILGGGPYQNMSPLSGTPFTSTFYVNTAYISSVLSTNKINVGVYTVGIQSV